MVYDPKAGIWLSRDPSGEAGGLNLTEAFNDDPINWDDPEGLSPASTTEPATTRPATRPTDQSGVVEKPDLIILMSDDLTVPSWAKAWDQFKRAHPGSQVVGPIATPNDIASAIEKKVNGLGGTPESPKPVNVILVGHNWGNGPEISFPAGTHTPLLPDAPDPAFIEVQTPDITGKIRKSIFGSLSGYISSITFVSCDAVETKEEESLYRILANVLNATVYAPTQLTTAYPWGGNFIVKPAPNLPGDQPKDGANFWFAASPKK